MEIKGRIVVLFKEEYRVFITKEKFVLLDCLAGDVPSGCSMWRVKAYDEDDGVIVLQPERGKCRDINDFYISSDANSSVINFLHLKKIIVEQSSRSAFFNMPTTLRLHCGMSLCRFTKRLFLNL